MAKLNIIGMLVVIALCCACSYRPDVSADSTVKHDSTSRQIDCKDHRDTSTGVQVRDEPTPVDRALKTTDSDSPVALQLSSFRWGEDRVRAVVVVVNTSGSDLRVSRFSLMSAITGCEFVIGEAGYETKINVRLRGLRSPPSIKEDFCQILNPKDTICNVEVSGIEWFVSGQPSSFDRVRGCLLDSMVHVRGKASLAITDMDLRNYRRIDVPIVNHVQPSIE